MADPWVPPYFGSWQDLINYVLHNPLGPQHNVPRIRAHSPAAGPQPDPWVWAQDPVPVPWRYVVASLVEAVNAKSLAQTVEGTAQRQIEESANASIAQILDDYCGTPPHVWPWPWPGPPPWIYPIASELNVIASSLEAGAMRDGLLAVAGQVLQRGIANVAAERAA